MLLDNHGTGPLTKDGLDHPAWAYIFTPEGGASSLAAPPAFATPAIMSVRGNFSSNFPKQSYNFTLKTDLGRDLAGPLLGMDNSADWALVATEIGFQREVVALLQEI